MGGRPAAQRNGRSVTTRLLRRLSSILLALAVAPNLIAAQVESAGLGAPGGAPAPGLRHEPIFGVGPHTTWRGGWGIEVEVQESGGEMVLPVEVLYGVTDRVTATLVLPFADAPNGLSLGEVGVRAKWRFATRYAPGLMDALALVGGLTLPRSAVTDVPLGGPNAMLGLAAGRESRRWYYFAGIRGLLRFGKDGFDPGEVLLTNLAWGIRP